MEFNIGDKIVYPNQGVGVIDNIEEKEFNGKKEVYYKMHIVSNMMKLSVPSSRFENAHIRPVSNAETLDSELEKIEIDENEILRLSKINYKERNEFFSEKIKAGSLTDMLDIITSLNKLKSLRTLNSLEKNIFRNTKKMLIDEICESKKVTSDEATDLLERSIS